jgi:hypothetical protein
VLGVVAFVVLFWLTARRGRAAMMGSPAADAG